MKKYLIVFFTIFCFVNKAYSQGYNHTWLIGYDIGLVDTNVTSTKARLNFDSTSVIIVPETRKMAFRATQGNISDGNGNLKLVSNGCWIANANGDTMLNGSGLNPGPFTTDWCDQISGIPLPHGNIILPFPGDSNKYILFHQTGTYNANLASTALFYSVIDMSLAGGLGGVIPGQKNLIALSDTLGWGLAACKHANGRDWWIVAYKDASNILFKILLTPAGITLVNAQVLNVPFVYANSTQPVFSPDGTKFAYSYGYAGMNPFHDVRLFHFDRCTGDFSDTTYMPFIGDNGAGLGLAFSPNSKYLYHSSFHKIYQINTDTNNIAVNGIDTVAINDGYYSPHPPFQTDFWFLYLASNGKIYISSGNSVIDLHYINFPDSAGVACDVHQHGLHLPCYFVRGNVYHPNYYLGRLIGSPCDTVWQGVQEQQHDFRFRVYPNPVTSNSLHIGYLLPENKAGVFQIYDVTGKVVFKYNLPQWSNEQQLVLPGLSDGVYNCVISSGMKRISKKFAVIRE